MTFIYLLSILAVVVIAVAFFQVKKTDLSQIEKSADSVLDEFFGDTKPTPPPIDLFADTVEEVKEPVKEEVIAEPIPEQVAAPVAEPVEEVKPEVKELVQELVAKEEVKKNVSNYKKKKYNKTKPKQ